VVTAAALSAVQLHHPRLVALRARQTISRGSSLACPSLGHGRKQGVDKKRTEQTGLRVIEHFTWSTRSGSGTSIFDEIR